jgi:hypothetical protein
MTVVGQPESVVDATALLSRKPSHARSADPRALGEDEFQ